VLTVGGVFGAKKGEVKDALHHVSHLFAFDNNPDSAIVGRLELGNVFNKYSVSLLLG